MLSNLSSRLHNLLITGVNLIDEDFRLQKAIEDFAVFKDKNPIFKKINDGLNKLLNDEEDKTSLLLSLISLVDAVNLTQAKFEEENDIEEIEYDEVKSIKQYKYSEISPIIDAFNSTGSGRYDIVKSAYNDKKELFEDYRVIKAVIKGLNDSYSELASLAFEILEETKINIVPELKDNFDKDGKSDMVRRLQLIGKLACDKENDFYLSLINDSSVAIRVIAISILPQSESNKKLVLDLINSEKGKVKKAAIVALGRYDCKESYEYFKKLIEKDKSYDEYLCLILMMN